MGKMERSKIPVKGEKCKFPYCIFKWMMVRIKSLWSQYSTGYMEKRDVLVYI